MPKLTGIEMRRLPRGVACIAVTMSSASLASVSTVLARS